MVDPCKFVEQLLCDTIQKKTSDLYLIPMENAWSVRCRCKGVEDQLEELPVDVGRRVVARLKVLAGLPGYIKVEPQSGAIGNINGCKGAEWRLSIMPTRTGERVAIRVVTPDVPFKYTSDLGLSDTVEAQLEACLKREAGLTIVTGPTGCGKSTTVYALVREMMRRENSYADVITLEDPVEQILPGVSQVAIRRHGDFSYVDGLRSALRQDVKTLLIGEMRDDETVKVALDAALSGHRILTTYHAGDIASVFARMLHQGAGSYLVAGAVSGVFTQRLLTGKDAGKRRAIAAGFLPDDAWCDFLTTHPGLSQIRNYLQEKHPESFLTEEGGNVERK
jgi:type II secretory ATPase GspE/PulE/Tfp pilus assembly ATPase PilB-like protein